MRADQYGLVWIDGQLRSKQQRHGMKYFKEWKPAKSWRGVERVMVKIGGEWVLFPKSQVKRWPSEGKETTDND